jgi:hypothetical protein
MESHPSPANKWRQILVADLCILRTFRRTLMASVAKKFSCACSLNMSNEACTLDKTSSGVLLFFYLIDPSVFFSCFTKWGGLDLGNFYHE